MDWTTFVPSLIGAGLGTTIVGAALGSWLNYKYELARKKREASVAVAKFLGEWVKPYYMGESSDEERWKLQTDYWENVLRLDKSVVDLLAEVLQNKPGGPNVKDVIVQARKVLHGLSEPDIKAAQIIHWPNRKDSLKT